MVPKIPKKGGAGGKRQGWREKEEEDLNENWGNPQENWRQVQALALLLYPPILYLASERSQALFLLFSHIPKSIPVPQVFS